VTWNDETGALEGVYIPRRDTGSLVNHLAGGRVFPGESPEDIAPELARLRSGAGTFAVLGNHDGWRDRDRVRRALVADGVQLVEDTAVKVDTAAGAVWVAGVSDLWTGPHDLGAALSAIASDAEPVLLLTHNPDVFPLVPDRVALTIAGPVRIRVPPAVTILRLESEQPRFSGAIQ
jgi:predicted MPP superfamily phosphohydrolase